jgi:hypothetical protein
MEVLPDREKPNPGMVTMSSNDGSRPDEGGVYRSTTARGISRRQMAVAGLAGLVLLGSGTYLITAQAGDGDAATTTGNVGAPAPEVPTAEPAVPDASPSPAEVSSTAASSAVATATSAKPSPTKTRATSPPDPEKVRKEINEARRKAEADGIPLQRPPVNKGKAVAQNLVSTRTEQTATGTIRITTARADLAGQQDQALAGDEGNPAGEARCTQKIRFTRSAPVRDIPTALLCWRTSDDRSVVTMAVVESGRPHAAASLAIIDREWAKLG